MMVRQASVTTIFRTELVLVENMGALVRKTSTSECARLQNVLELERTIYDNRHKNADTNLRLYKISERLLRATVAGRPCGIPRARLTLTYKSALEHACSPQDLLEITKRAVADAKKGDHYARMYIAKIMGLDSLRITVDPTSAGAPMPVYNLNALDDEELAVLDQLSNKMMISGSGPDDT